MVLGDRRSKERFIDRKTSADYSAPRLKVFENGS